MESPRLDLFIDSFIFMNNQIKTIPNLPAYPKQIWDYLKQAFVFTTKSLIITFLR